MQSGSHILNNQQEATPTWLRFHENGVDNLNVRHFEVLSFLRHHLQKKICSDVMSGTEIMRYSYYKYT